MRTRNVRDDCVVSHPLLKAAPNWSQFRNVSGCRELLSCYCLFSPLQLNDTLHVDHVHQIPVEHPHQRPSCLEILVQIALRYGRRSSWPLTAQIFHRDWYRNRGQARRLRDRFNAA